MNRKIILPIFFAFFLISVISLNGCKDKSTGKPTGKTEEETTEPEIVTEQETETDPPKPVDTEPVETEPVETEPVKVEVKASKILNVRCILQNPQLPTGCEVTSLTMVLNYYGYNIDKCSLSDIYLDKGIVGETNPNIAFIGNPRDGSSFG